MDSKTISMNIRNCESISVTEKYENLSQTYIYVVQNVIAVTVTRVMIEKQFFYFPKKFMNEI